MGYMVIAVNSAGYEIARSKSYRTEAAANKELSKLAATDPRIEQIWVATSRKRRKRIK
jgi:hypothetical protein